MNRLSLLSLLGILFGVAFFLPAAGAQAAPGRSATAAAACPATATLDQLIHALYASVSGPADQDRTCFRDVMLPDARLMPLVKGPDGTVAPRVLTVDEWIDRVRRRGSAGFYERQVKGITEAFGNLGHVWSTYETRPTPDGKVEARGINSIQAAFDGKRWRIVSILWLAETDSEKVPEKYLP